MIQEDYSIQEFSYYPSFTASVLDAPSEPLLLTEGDAFLPPDHPAEPPVVSPSPRRRPGRPFALILLSLVFALIFGLGLFAGWVFTSHGSSTGGSGTISSQAITSSPSSNSVQTAQEAAIAKAEPGVVELEVTTMQGEQIGSGVIIDAKGDIVTNNHVVSGEQTIQVVLYNGNTEQAQLIGTSTGDDLAVVRIAPFANMTVVQLGDSSQLTVGQEVLAIGNPLGITETVTRGIVSGLKRSVTESTGTTITDAVQTDAAINPGNSGGALINLQGQLVGIPTLTAVNTESNTAANGLSFAISSNLMRTAVAQMLQ